MSIHFFIEEILSELILFGVCSSKAKKPEKRSKRSTEIFEKRRDGVDV